MKILAVGINHKTSPIALREKFCLNALEKELLLSTFKQDARIGGGIVVTTCNRCEMYLSVVDDCNPIDVIMMLFDVKSQPRTDELLNMFYSLQGADAVTHMLAVACGLDSLILGEKQILGQIKEAVALSREKGMMDKALNMLMNTVLETGKKARQETTIDVGGISVSAAAVSMAQQLLGSLQDKSILVVGSGKMGCLALNYLHQRHAKHIYLMNRTVENASAVAMDVKAEVVPFWEMKTTLQAVDVCICSSSAPHYVITKDLMQHVTANRQTEIILIDISMPRNIEPTVKDVNGVQLVSLDDLDRVIECNLQKRKDAVNDVNILIARKKEEFFQALAKNRQIHEQKQLMSIG